MNKTSFGFRCLFQILCFLATMTMSIYCFIKYLRDEDVSMITYKQFHGSKDGIYPSISLCFYNPFKEKKLNEYGVNISLYSEFLQGLYWDPKMESIDYEEVTLQIEDFLCDVTMDSHDLTWIDYKEMKKKHDKIFGNRCHSPTNHSHHKISTPYVHYRSGFNKCFTFNVPYEPNVSVTYFSINLRSHIFPNGIRPPRADFDVKSGTGSGFYVSFHYPYQFFRADRTIKRTWDPLFHTHDNYSKEKLGPKWKNYEMRFRFSDMSISKMRYRSNWQSKAQPNCNPDWTKDDQVCMSAIMERAGCNLPYWKANKELDVCATKEGMKQAQPLSNVNISKWCPPPCQAIEKLTYQYEEVEMKEAYDDQLDKDQAPWFRIVLLFYAQTYKEISQVKAFDMEMLVGNIGGYLGLFLGYALLQIPDLFIKAKNWLIFKFHLIGKLLEKQQTTIDVVSEEVNNSDDDANKMHSVDESLTGVLTLDQLTNRLDYLDKNFKLLSDIVYKINDNFESAMKTHKN